MKARLTQYVALGASIAGWILGVGGCSTAEVSPRGVLPALPPPYVQVPHPGGYTMGDLRAIFTSPGAPKLEDLKDCDADFKKLKSLTQAQMELIEGSRELVRRDPVKYHWCFYGKLMLLESDLKSESYLDEKQKSVLDVYGSLTPMARAFMQEYHDSRYMRWGIRYYKQVSEWVFYRKVEMTPQETSELVEASNPFGLLRDPSGMVPVLEKYNIVRPDPQAMVPTAPTTVVAPVAAASPTPAPSDAPPAPTTAEAAPAPSPSVTEAVPPVPRSTEAVAPSPTPAVDPNTPPPMPEAAPTPPVVTDSAPAAQPPAPAVDPNTPPPPVANSAPQAAPAANTPAPADRQPAKDQQPPAPPDNAPAPPAPSAQDLSPDDGTTEAVLQGDSVVPTEKSN